MVELVAAPRPGADVPGLAPEMLPELGGQAYGSAVAVDGALAAVGAPGEERVYVLERVESRWKVVFVIESPASDVSAFGGSLALDDGRVLVGATGGRAFLYQLGAGGPVLVADTAFSSDVGRATAVALEGDRILVGDGRDVRAFVIDAHGLRLAMTLRPHDAPEGFGSAVALCGDRAVVGAPEGEAAVVFVAADAPESYGKWHLAHRLAGDPLAAGRTARFGAAVAIRDGSLLVGAPLDGDDHRGAVYVFVDRDDSWKRIQRVEAPEPELEGYFGAALALAGEVAVVGSDLADLAGTDSGTAYVFKATEEGTLVLGRALIAHDAAEADLFGAAVATDGSTTLVGAPFADDERTTDRGAVYFY